MDLLSEEEKSRLNRSLWLQDILKSKRLQSQIIGIDKSDDSLTALRELRKVNPEFDEFVYKILEVIDCDDIDKMKDVASRKRKSM